MVFLSIFVKKVTMNKSSKNRSTIKRFNLIFLKILLLLLSVWRVHFIWFCTTSKQQCGIFLITWRTLPLDNKTYLAIYTELFCAWMFQYFFKSSQIPKILKFLAYSNSQCVQYNSCLQFLRWFFKPILVSCALSLCKRKEECKQIGQG